MEQIISLKKHTAASLKIPKPCLAAGFPGQNCDAMDILQFLFWTFFTVYNLALTNK